MNPSLTDEEMIRRFRSGQSAQCFEALYNRYVNKVYRRCLSMTKDPLKAEDFTHDIFLKVFNKLDAFQERSSFSTWLYSIAFNYCSDQLRLAERLTTSPLEAETERNLAEPNEAQLHEETIYLVKQIMVSLSPREQALLELKYEDGLSIEQIADLYHIKASAVKMRLKRCREKIHRLYERQSAM